MNDLAKNFLRDQHRPDNVNLVTMVASTVDVIMKYFKTRMVVFESRSTTGSQTPTPFIWTPDYFKIPTSHLNSEESIMSIASVADTLTVGFFALKRMCQGPCPLNQLSAKHILNELSILSKIYQK
jgi:hypothetical protein